jgi:peptide/nickel transport system permease protein
MGLQRYILKRVLLTVPILVGVSIITFLLVNLAPGNPVEIFTSLNPDLSPAERARLEAKFGKAGFQSSSPLTPVPESRRIGV